VFHAVHTRLDPVGVVWADAARRAAQSSHLRFNRFR